MFTKKMLRRNLYIGFSILFLTLSSCLTSGGGLSNLYTFNPDKNWRKQTYQIKGLYEFYEVSGIVLSPEYDGGPVIATIFIFNMGKANSLEQAEEVWEKFSRQDNDIIYYNNSPKRATSNHSWGTSLYMYSNFYRKSKGLYQTRFEYISIHPQTKDIINITVSIQHNDSTFQIDQRLRLQNLSNYVFEKFSIDQAKGK